MPIYQSPPNVVQAASTTVVYCGGPGQVTSVAVTALLQSAGWPVGRDRVQRIWRREGLKVPQKQRARGRLWLGGWLDRNPARMMKAIRVKQVPTGYFTREEFKRIVDGTYAYGGWQGGHDFHHRAERLRALILLTR